MRKKAPIFNLPPRWVGVLLGAAALVVFYLAWKLAAGQDLRVHPVLFWLPGFTIAGLAGWIGAMKAGLERDKESLQQQVGALQGELPETRRRLDAIMQLNRILVDAEDEQSLMDSALEIVAGVVGANAVTFVPMDEWGQPLSAFTYGDLPEPMLKAWADHLATERVRTRCRNCQTRFVAAGAPCPILEGPFARKVTVYCLPMNRGDRMLGMLNLHLPAGSDLSGEMQRFLDVLLNEIALAVQTIRLRNQELNTLRQLQMLRTSKADLSVLIGSILEGLQQAVDVEFVLLQVRALDAWQPGLQLQKGFAPWMEPKTITDICERVNQSAQPYHSPAPEAQSDGAHGYHWAVPLLLPEGGVLGTLLVANKRPAAITEREIAMMQSTAAQISLLVENERMFLSLEYNAVIQERIRLAREIHDGLAQTLAFLKLKTSQMQNFLVQGDFTRLSQVLQQNYHALAEAYLDTRQAIDNLRLTPQLGLVHWLDRIAADFEVSSGLTIERNLDVQQPPNLSPEVQAQLIRIVQEALNNVRKHARAQRAWINLREWEGDLILEVGDDGQGFDPQDIPELSQYGLRGMRERAEFIGADFQITSQSHDGTTVRLRWPRYEETPT